AGPAAASGSDGHRLGVDADLLAGLAPPLKHHVPVDLGKQGVVLAQADVDAGMNARPPLAHEDAAGRHLLAAEPLDAQPLGDAVPSVLGAATALLGGKQLQIHDKSHRRLLPPQWVPGCSAGQGAPILYQQSLKENAVRPDFRRGRPPPYSLPSEAAPPGAPAPGPGTGALLPEAREPSSPARFGPPARGSARPRLRGTPETRPPA